VCKVGEKGVTPVGIQRGQLKRRGNAVPRERGRGGPRIKTQTGKEKKRKEDDKVL